MKKVKWGVIGAGGIAFRRTIPEAVRDAANVELVSVMDHTAERAKLVAKQFNVPHWCSTEQELLAQDLDAVYIATPQNVHARQVIQAAEAGKHILCEKPIAVSLAEVDQMQAAIEKAGVTFMVGFCMRYNVYNQKARELVQSGALGQTVAGRAQLTCWYPPIPNAWRQDLSISHGGALIDMGTHCLDLLEWIQGTRITEVVGFQDLRTHGYRTPIEDTSTVIVRFANGAHGIIDNYFNLPDAAAQNALEIHGTRGSLMATGTIGQDPTGKMFTILQPQETGYDPNQVRDMPAARNEYHFEGIGLYGQMVSMFADCILENKTPPITLEDGRHSVRVIETIYQAVQQKRVLAVAD
jgi:UDP-N-acetyl-2-amino-2-deoxyglucuronate dehydrogenase